MNKEALKYLGLEHLDTESETFLEDFKSGVNENLIPRNKVQEDESIVNSIVGKNLGALQTKIKKTTREILGDLPEGAFDGVEKADEMLAKSKELISEYVSSQESSLKESYSKDVSKRESELLEKLEIANSINDRNKEQLSEWETKYNDAVKSKDEAISSFKLDLALKGVREKADLKSDMTEIERKGFNEIISDKYNFKLGENNEVMVFDKTNKPIANPNDATKNLTALDVYNLEAVNNKLGKVVQETTQVTKPAQERTGDKPRVHRLAQA